MTTPPWTLMEFCGGQTHTIVKYGVDQLLPEGLELVHGPGCPVCVTPLELIDRAHAIASRRAEVENAYSRTVSAEGNPSARRVVDEVFEVPVLLFRPFRALSFPLLQSAVAVARERRGQGQGQGQRS